MQTHKHTGYTLVKRKRQGEKKRKREITPAKTKIHHGQLTRSENSQTQIQESKSTTTLFKLLPLYKSKATPLLTIITSWRKCKTLETRVEEK